MIDHQYSAEQLETVYTIMLAAEELNKEGIRVSSRSVEAAVLCCLVESDLIERAGVPGPFMTNTAKQWMLFAQGYALNDSLQPGDIAALVQRSADPAKYREPRLLARVRAALGQAQQGLAPSPTEDVLKAMSEHTMGDAELGTCMCNINITWTPEHQLREMRKVASVIIQEPIR